MGRIIMGMVLLLACSIVIAVGWNIASAPPPAPSSQEDQRLKLPAKVIDGRFYVVAKLKGDVNREVPVTFIVDETVNILVVPPSLMSVLGYRPNSLRETVVSAPKGTLAGREARLRGLILPTAPEEITLPEVRILFPSIEMNLGEYGLIGTSILGRFEVQYDEKDSVIYLSPRL